MTDQYNRTACSLCNGGNSFEYRTYFVCSVDINVLADVTLDRIENHKLRARFGYGFFNTLIRQRKRIGIFNNIEHHIFICTCFNEPWLDGVTESVLSRLVNHIKRFCNFHTGQSHARRASGGKSQSKSCFTLAGIALNNNELPERDIRFP